MLLSKYRALWTRNPELAFHGVRQRQPGFRSIDYRPGENWRFKINFFELGSVGISYGETSGWSVKSEGDTHIRLIMPINGTTRFVVGRTERITPNHLTFVPIGSSFSESNGSKTVLIRMDKSRLAEALQALGLEQNIDNRIDKIWITPSEELLAFERVVRLALRQIEEIEAVLDQSAFQSVYEELFYLHAAQAISQVAEIRPGSRKVLDRMIDYIQSNLSKSLSIKEIASVGGVSVRVAQLTFKKELLTTMTLFIRSRRLIKAREILQLKQVSTVTDAALSVGFNHLSEFSRVYREQFGETPNQTLSERKKT